MDREVGEIEREIMSILKNSPTWAAESLATNVLFVCIRHAWAAAHYVDMNSTNNAAAWTTNSPAPVVIGGQNVVLKPLSGLQQFFRLKH